MPSPNVGIFEEISDQHLDEFSAGNQLNWPTHTCSLFCWPSNTLGNTGGKICTLTVECQSSCND